MSDKKETTMMMQRCVWDFLPAGAVSVRLTRPSGSSTCSIEPLILSGCGIDFLFFFVFVGCGIVFQVQFLLFVIFFHIPVFRSVFFSLSLSLCFYLSLSFLVLPSSSLQYRVDKGSSVYFLCLCCLCFYLSLFHIHFCLQCTMQHEQWKVWH